MSSFEVHYNNIKFKLKCQLKSNLNQLKLQFNDKLISCVIQHIYIRYSDWII